MNKPVQVSYSQPSRETEFQCLKQFKRLPGASDLCDTIAAKVSVMTPDEMRGLASWLRQQCYETLKARAAERQEDFPEWDKFRL